MEELIEQIELKGIPTYRLHELLSKNGFQIFVFDPTPQGQYRNDFYLERNNRAIEKALTEVRHMI